MTLSAYEEEVVQMFKKAAWEVDHKTFEDLNIEDKISALGIDSVAMLEVIGYFEEEYDIHLPDEKLSRVETVRDLAELIEQTRPSA
jgi:acyl carrier protein